MIFFPFIREVYFFSLCEISFIDMEDILSVCLFLDGGSVQTLMRNDYWPCYSCSRIEINSSDLRTFQNFVGNEFFWNFCHLISIIGGISIDHATLYHS